jgi:hypothetical protein
MSIFETFKDITRFDIQLYFEDYVSFIESDYQRIVDFYEKGSELSSTIITKLKDLYNRMLQINDLFNIYNDRLSSTTVEAWELLDYFEQTKVNLLTIINSSRWLRSTKNIFFNNSVNHNYILKQGQSFEQLSNEIGNSDIHNTWSNIAVDNNIREEDYTFEGGAKLKISFTNNFNYTVNSVIDSISGEKLYGKDVNRFFYFENNDLAVLEYRENIIQQTKILLGLVKGSVPEFPLDGISKDFLGTNINALQYPTILRQQAEVFEKDDRYKSISVKGFSVEQNSLKIDVEVMTKLNEVLSEELVL